MLIKKFTKMLLAGSLILSCLVCHSQVKLSGTIIDAGTGKPLSGTNVKLENSFLSTSSGKDGKYQININKTVNQLRFSYIGYETFVIELNPQNDTVVNVALGNTSLLGEEVNIIATRVQAGTPATFTNISSKMIEEINLGKDMPYILQSTPSVLVTSDAGTGIGYTGITIRGSDLTRINVTMNGIPVNDAESQGVWFVDLPDLASSTSNIQVQRGVGTSTNGSGAFGASINIQTQTLVQNAYGEVSSSVGSYNTYKNTLKFGTGLMKNKFAFDGRASYISSEGYIDRASAKLQSLHFSGGYFGKTTTIKANFLSGNEITYQAWEGVPKDSLKTNRTYNSAGKYIDKNGNTAYYKNQTDNYHQDHYQLLFSQSAGKNLNFNAALFYTKGSGYYENYKQDESFSDYGFNDLIFGSDTISSTDLINRKYLDNDYSGLTFSGNYSGNDKLKITVGGSYSRYHGRHSGKIIWANYSSNGNNDRNWYYNTGEKKDFTVYAKINYRIIKNINLYGDIQYRYVDHLMNGTEDDLSVLNQQHKFNFVNPKAGIYFDLSDNHKAYFSFGIANREPNRSNYEDADPDHIPESEKLFDYEIGYDLTYSRFKAGVNLYYMNYKDQLVLTGEINNTGAAIMTNVFTSNRTGVEFVFSASLMKWFNWNVNVTLSKNKIDNFIEYVDTYDVDWNFTGQSEKNLGRTDLSFSPGVMGYNEFSFIPLKNLALSLQSRYAGRQNIDNTSNKDRSLDPYLVHNIVLAYSIKPKWIGEIGLNFQVNNIFSHEYETNAWIYRYNLDGTEYEINGYFPQAPINFLAGVSIKF